LNLFVLFSHARKSLQDKTTVDKISTFNLSTSLR